MHRLVGKRGSTPGLSANLALSADLASELAGREILIPPNSPSDGVAFIVENGAPIELLEFPDPNHPARRQKCKDADTPSIQSTS